MKVEIELKVTAYLKPRGIYRFSNGYHLQKEVIIRKRLRNSQKYGIFVNIC